MISSVRTLRKSCLDVDLISIDDRGLRPDPEVANAVARQLPRFVVAAVRSSGRRAVRRLLDRVQNVARRGFSPILTWGPRHIFPLDLAYLAVLALLLIGRPAKFWYIDKIPTTIGGVVPAAVVWFGALGAVTLSMYGLFDHNARWDTRFNYWHVARPFVGAIFATVSFLIFVSVLNATGSASLNTSVSDTTGSKSWPYLVVGFIVGFRESTFRELLQRTLDVILGPGVPGRAAVPLLLLVNPSALPAGDADVTVIVTVINTSQSPRLVTSIGVVVEPVDAAVCTGLTPASNPVLPPGASQAWHVVVTPKPAVGPYALSFIATTDSATARSTARRQ